MYSNWFVMEFLEDFVFILFPQAFEEKSLIIPSKKDNVD